MKPICNIHGYDPITGRCLDQHSDIEYPVQCKDFPECTMRLRKP